MKLSVLVSCYVTTIACFTLLYISQTNGQDNTDIFDNSSPPEVQVQLQELINIEVKAILQYVCQGNFYARASLKGYSALFYRIAQKHVAQAFKLIDYMRIRNNTVSFPTNKTVWSSGLDALQDALNYEIYLYDVAYEVNKVAEQYYDEPTTDYLNYHQFENEVALRRKFYDYYNRRTLLIGYPNAEYYFDLHLQTDPAAYNTGQPLSYNNMDDSETEVDKSETGENEN